MIERIKQSVLNRLHRNGLYTENGIQRVHCIVTDEYNVPERCIRSITYSQITPFLEFRITLRSDLPERMYQSFSESEEYLVESMDDGRFKVLERLDEDTYERMGVLSRDSTDIYVDFITEIEDAEFEPSPDSKRKLEMLKQFFQIRN